MSAMAEAKKSLQDESEPSSPVVANGADSALLSASLQDESGPSSPVVANGAESALLSAMARVRSEVVGNGSSLWKCDKAAHRLCAEVQQLNLEAALGHGRCEVVGGAFLSTFDGSAMPHAFVRFEDGSIADVTADQFDDALPAVWWPADASRYHLTRVASVHAALLNAKRVEDARRVQAANATAWWAGC